MTQILADYSVSISELKKSPSTIIEEAGDNAVAILNHNKPSAYLLPSELYENIVDILDDYLLAKDVKERLNDGEEPIEVRLDEL